ncbi:MAG: cell surface protein SprA [Spirosomaceae bacterium]|nr:cell surface protein SprA [Spirosomataceae bacterium]
MRSHKNLYRILTHSYLIWTLLGMLILLDFQEVMAQTAPARRTAPVDTSRANRQRRRLLYSRWEDRFTNRYVVKPPRSSLYLKDPKSLSNDFQMDTTRKMSVYERVGELKAKPLDYRNPLTMSYEDFQKLQDRRVFNNLMRDYSAKQDGKGALGARGLLPKLDLPPGLDRIFGSNLVDFKPNGFVLLDVGVLHQNIDNPQIPIRQRRQTIPIFNEQININFNGKIGDNLGLNTNWDTKSSFNFENQIKLDYRPGGLPNRNNLPNGSNLGQNGMNQGGFGQNQGGFGQNGMGQNGFGQNNMGGMGMGQSDFGEQSYIPENESIIQRVQAGNINWQLPLQLIPSVQNLRGLRLDLRFGRLNVGLLASQQLSRQQCMTLRGGAQNRQFELRADNYDENRHFFLSYYFRDNYERWLSNLPMILSGVTITRVEAYVTNRNNNTETLRNIVAFSDMGESKPFSRELPVLQPITPNRPVDNKNNGLYQKLTEDTQLREADRTTFVVESNYNLKRGTDYDLLRGARKLTEREFKFHPELGYVSLLTPLRNDEVLAVAYEYTLNGQRFKVGELTEDYQARRDDEVLVLKLLRSATIRNNTQHPLWDLMMKNIYSLNTSQLSKQNFQMRVIYKDDLTGIDNPHLQEGRKLANVPLLRVMGLDKLNPVNDPVLDSQRNPIGDGNFDFVEGVTVDTRFGRLIFPTLEPFGASLGKKFDPDEEVLRNKYVFNELYRTTQIDAQQITEKNKFFLKGTFQGSAGGATIQLPFGVSDRSVVVRAGGMQLQPGSDFTVEGQGAVRITNESVLNSGRDIEVCYEQPDLFNNQIRTTLGTRLEYTANANMRFGVTAMRMRETPPGFLTRAALGNDPINNSVIGADINFRKESQFLTRMLDALPLLQTKEPSSINFQGEVAQSFAGLHPKVRNRIIVDDFEAARTQFDLTRQPTRWRVGGTPLQFPQGTPDNPLEYAYNRAKMSAYTIDISFSPNAQVGLRDRPTNITAEDLNNVYERLFTPQEIFTGRGAFLVNLPEAILDVAYYPHERGVYNYNPNLDPDGNLRNPRRNFGAITRAISSDPDFDNANVEILEFWMMDPFKQGPNGIVRDGFFNQNNRTGGKLYFTLGEASEDIVKNGRYDFENGLPLDEKRLNTVGGQNANVARTPWGFSTKQQFIINAFTNEPGAREKQDVGLDGLSNAEERTFFNDYLQRLPSNLKTEARRKIEADPSGDDFEFYFSSKADSANKKIVERYKNFMGMENNTPEFQSNNDITAAATNLPDAEDLNQDNTINDQEGYYEYEIDLKPGQLDVGKPYIVDKVTAAVSGGESVDWYLFRVPVREFTRKVGNINGFKSIRFVRMYMTDWEQPVVLRFAQLQLVATQYRKYVGDLNARGLQEVPEPYDAQFKIATVSAEENSAQTVTGGRRQIYAVPAGWERDVDFTTINQRPLNEQAMSLCVSDLRDGDARAAFKNVPSTNLLFRKRLKMYVHMHNDQDESGQVTAFMRLGTDVSEHFYEIEVTNLQATPPNRNEPEVVWPQQNEIDIEINWLTPSKSATNWGAFIGLRSWVGPI